MNEERGARNEKRGGGARSRRRGSEDEEERGARRGEMEKARSCEVQTQSEMQAQPDTRARWARIADRGLWPGS